MYQYNNTNQQFYQVIIFNNKNQIFNTTTNHKFTLNYLTKQ
jgi:hypothetical protein